MFLSQISSDDEDCQKSSWQTTCSRKGNLQEWLFPWTGTTSKLTEIYPNSIKVCCNPSTPFLFPLPLFPLSSSPHHLPPNLIASMKNSQDRTPAAAEAEVASIPRVNFQMAEAARNVGKKAGINEHEIVNDLMGKLDEVFVGMGGHVKKGARQSARKKNLDQTQFGKNLDFQPPKDMNAPLPKMGKGEVDIDDIMADAAQIDVPRQMPQSSMISKPFTNVEKLLESQPPLGIFSHTKRTKSKAHSGSSLKLWEKFQQAEVYRNTRFEPLNWFDQCIVWTEEGKLWKFPIDNEQGMDEEAKVDFTEHIFLDHHIEHWCPTEGPIRHFMELVLVGLSKNPFITVAEKIDTLKWYEEYFSKHEALLKEINALGSVANPIPVEGKITEV
ncbi:hypothetical protein FOCC_FOCC007688 [Frankliniella occidentalis]|nr:hypothetical protein FOCC_FOCC007688 [Frankliniella occidentalis]